MNIWNDEAPGFKELLNGELECDHPRSWLRLRADVLWMWFIMHICGTDLMSHNWDVEDDGYSQCQRCYDEQGGAMSSHDGHYEA